MTEQVKTPPQSDDATLQNYVPKTEHEEAIKSSEKSIAGLKEEINNAKMQLLDPDYLTYLETKKKETEETNKPTIPAGADEGLKALQLEIRELNKQLVSQKNALSQIWYDRELEKTKAKYTDFEDFKADIQKIIETSPTEKTFEEAYLLAKAHKLETDKASGKAPTGKPFPTEKPNGTVPAKTLETKEYETEGEANAATIAALQEKYPNIGDTI